MLVLTGLILLNAIIVMFFWLPVQSPGGVATKPRASPSALVRRRMLCTVAVEVLGISSVSSAVKPARSSGPK